MVIIKDREIRLLEFEHIRSQLAEFAVTPMGKERALQLYPTDHLPHIRRTLQETTEAGNLLEKNFLKVQPVPDIRTYLEKIQKGGVIEALGLFRVKEFLQAAQKLKNKIQDDQIEEAAPRIVAHGNKIDGCLELARRLQKSVGMEGEILDTASDELKEIRDKQKGYARSIQEKLDQYIKSPSYQKYIQEPIVTIRNERYVIPIKQEYRGKISGIFHDQSSSGATLYVEPFAVVDLQNKFQQQKQLENKEIERILNELSEKIGAHLVDLENDVEVYSLIDFILAKGELSYHFRSTEPEVTGEPIIDLRGARHPLLKKEEAVPIDVSLGKQNQVLVITGPNTGGKTVTLKTVGLLSIMMQSGLHLPTKAGTRLGVFDLVRADIGDEQSLEQSLSTFSGHLVNIMEILKEVGPRSLVLLDELGAGTDPSEGAALARSILMELWERGSLVISSTHINDLKIFAQMQEGVQNASLEFDVETLSPTYRLIMGIPGSSNALEVASRLGLPDEIVEKAKNYLTKGHEEVEKIIKSLGDEQKRLKEDTHAAELERRQAEELRRELEKEREDVRAKKEEIVSRAKQEARSLIKQAKKQADDSVGEIHKTLSSLKEGEKLDKPVAKAEEARRELQEFTRNIEEEVEEEYPRGEEVNKEELREGDKVWLKSLNQEGIVLQVPSFKDDVYVQVGEMRISTNWQDLRRLSSSTKESKQPQEQKVHYSFRKRNKQVSPEINLRGFTLDEAVDKLEKYLDDAVLNGLNQVVIIHGKGTGKLRRGIHKVLENHRLVEDYRLGDFNEGGMGVTVVNLRKKQS